MTIQKGHILQKTWMIWLCAMIDPVIQFSSGISQVNIHRAVRIDVGIQIKIIAGRRHTCGADLLLQLLMERCLKACGNRSAQNSAYIVDIYQFSISHSLAVHQRLVADIQTLASFQLVPG